MAYYVRRGPFCYRRFPPLTMILVHSIIPILFDAHLFHPPSPLTRSLFSIATFTFLLHPIPLHPLQLFSGRLDSAVPFINFPLSPRASLSFPLILCLRATDGWTTASSILVSSFPSSLYLFLVPPNLYPSISLSSYFNSHASRLTPPLPFSCTCCVLSV